MKDEVLRKAVHAILAVFFGTAGPLLGLYNTLILAGGLLLVFLIVRLVRRLHFFQRRTYISYGEFFFVGGVVLSALLFLPTYTVAFQAGMLVLAFADTAASVIGVRFGKHPYHFFGERRSFEGSLACFVVATVILSFFGITFPLVIAGGLALMFVEALAPRGFDNFMLPVVAGLLIVLL